MTKKSTYALVKLTLLILFSFKSYNSYTEKKPKTYYIWTREHIEISSKSQADFYLPIPPSAREAISGRISAFYPDGTPYGSFTLKEGEPNGYYEVLYKNGSSKETGHLSGYELIGKKIERYPSESIKNQYSFIKVGDKVEKRLIAHWDSNGNQTIKGGNGTFSTYYDNGSINETGLYRNGKKADLWTNYFQNGKLSYSETYTADTGELIQGTSYDEDGNTYTYDQIFTSSYFIGGENAWIEFLTKNLRYPKNASDNDIQGDVHLRFTISSTGAVKDVIVSDGIRYGCDKEAKRVLKKTPDWSIPLMRGQPVNVLFRTVIKFRLR